MVSFTELQNLVKKNPTRLDSVPRLDVIEPIRNWTITHAPVKTAPIPMKTAPAPTPVKTAPTPVKTAPAPTPVKTAPTPAPIVPSGTTTTPTPKQIKSFGRSLDLISVGIQDPMYMEAPVLTARQIEKEEALRIIELVPTLYSAEGGRSRGWTKKMLDFYLRPRAACGGDLFELRKGKVSFDWLQLFTSKEHSGIFDFICLAKEIRCVVWKDPLHFGLWPAADKAVLSKDPPLIHLYIQESGEARCCNGVDTMKELFEWADSTPGAGWIPALSCSSILATHTVAELEEEAKKLGIVSSGKKSEQIVQIAAARRRRAICL
jgi:hypothetical protein